jgi:hypothetical protein
MGNIIWGILLILGGLSGQFVLIGTNSSGALIALGVGLVIWGIIKTATSSKEQPVSTASPEQNILSLNLNAPKASENKTVEKE